MPNFDIMLLVRFFLLLMIVSGFWFGLYLIIRAYKKTLKRVAYFIGFIFVSISTALLLILTIPRF